MKLSEEMIVRKDISFPDWIQEVKHLEEWINLLDGRIVLKENNIKVITEWNNKLRATVIHQKTTIAKLQKDLQQSRELTRQPIETKDAVFYFRPL